MMSAAAEDSKGREISIAQVEVWFREAWPEQETFPTSQSYYSIAVRLNIVRNVGEKPPTRPHVLGRAAPAARSFLRYIGQAREEIGRRTDHQTDETLRQLGGLAYPPLLTARRKLDAAEAAIIELLAACDPMPWNDPARFIEKHVVDAWSRVPSANPRLGQRPEDPMVQFLQTALSAAGINLQPDTIYDRLRNRKGGGGRRDKAPRGASRAGAKIQKSHP